MRRQGLLWGGVFTGLGAVGLVIAFLLDPARAFLSSLLAFTYGMTTSVGALWLLMISYVVDAKWLQRLRPITEGIALLIPVFGLLLIPVLTGTHALYPWATPEIAELTHHEAEVLAHKSLWLSPGAFIGRSIFYVVLWSALVALLFIFRRRPKSRAVQWASALGLPLVGLSFTLAVFDWQMSLDPFWYSTLYGVYLLAGGFLATLAWLAVLSPVAVRLDLYPTSLRESSHPLGILTHALVIFWSYVSFMQLLIIWSANLPEEVVFYERRIADGWEGVSALLVLGHFFIPFFVLLFRPIKRNPLWLAYVGVWLLVMRAVDTSWALLPSRLEPPLRFLGGDLAAIAIVAGVLLTLPLAYVRRERGRIGADDLIEEGGHGER